MNSMSDDVRQWLYTQKNWLQEAAERLLKSERLLDQDIVDIVNLIKTSQDQKPQHQRTFSELSIVNSLNNELRLKSIGKIYGIENLAPRQPLNFGNENLVVIFGHNGSGKSSYSKIIKNLSGKPRAGIIKANAFLDPPTTQNCEVTYSDGIQEHVLDWHIATGAVDTFRIIDIFDSEESQYYLNKENTISYTPTLIKLFEGLAKACDEVKSFLQSEKAALISTLPDIPTTYLDTKFAEQYKNFSHKMTESDIQQLCSWSEQDEAAVKLLDDRLKESDPLATAKKIKAIQDQLSLLIRKIEHLNTHYNEQSIKNIDLLRNDLNNKKKIAADASSIIKGQILEGIGSESWKAMWEAARTYSNFTAYPTDTFPVLKNCVLCHQDLSIEAQQLFTKFEQYVQGKIETDVKIAQALYNEKIKLLPPIPLDEEVSTLCTAAELNEDWIKYIKAFFLNAKLIQQIITGTLKHEGSIKFNNINEALDKLRQIITNYQIKITQLESDAKNFDRQLAEATKRNLEMKRWIFQQKVQVEKEIARLKQVEQYDNWINLTNSRTISTKANAVTEAIITESYVLRFNQELKNLGANRLKVELIKTKIAKGRPLHKLQLKAAKNQLPIETILSEGERRIVTLAAFLADVAEKPYKAPFVFDDPISSLDQMWEEKTIERLVELSQTRQVIVFTHRLSMLGMLTEKADKISTIHIRQEHWGAGEAGEIPLYGKKPEAALKDLKNNRIAKAKKVHETAGQEEYYPLAKSICSDLRILTERIVEFVFLADVIQRHRRAVNTQGKIHKLAHINFDDCHLIEEIMTKYSCYEHSQSLEAPTEIPEPNELESDIDKILDWHAEFTKRVA
ncbi:AAA family ATPase [Acinetobacter modestus]|uniref:AAA family ATPase n=1 Tax=Acinetobacter modestus TaxID=1776740 RepID=UPI0020306971|nr:AAA family ATPase [Acinetobacter modestus]MCM1958202.1 AAA family ATPase [Acinetobacter modestus]